MELCVHSTPVHPSCSSSGAIMKKAGHSYMWLLVNVGHSSVGYVPRGRIAGSRDVCGQL